MMAAPTRRLAGVPAPARARLAMPKAHRVADHPQAGRSREWLGRLAAEPENRQHPASLKKLDDNPIVGRDRVQRL